MSPAAKLWLRIFLAGFVIITGLLILTLFTPPYYGDLSRIGRLSEREFGWRLPPPTVPAEHLKGVPIDQADILVIGDSFSMTFRWQSELVKAGHKVTTIYWGQIGVLCSDFNPWLRRAGFHGKLVIVESVERLLDERLKDGEKCATMPRDPEVKTEPFWTSPPQVPGFEFNTGAKLMTGLITYSNTREALRSAQDTRFGETQVRKVADGCALFSHRSCDRALFFGEDVSNGPLDETSVTRMQAFTQTHPDVPLLWMIIPNKTTVYIEPDNSKPFVQALARTKLGPDLFGFARQQYTGTRDLYFPNDTHLSMHGQLALGRRMAEAVRNVLPTAAVAP
ncbi:MAG: hypothetical protein JWQ03_2290 [Variovorax sp.]|nr:hypothetical protein [Variovorax sp.]